MHAPTDPIPLAEQHCQQAAHVLARAFHQDPMMRLVVPNDAKRARLLPSFFGIAVRYCLSYGEGYVMPGLEGAACWLRPGDTMPGLVRLVRIGIRSAPLGIGLPGLRRYMDVARFAEEVHARCVPAKHWYLWCIGVDPARQGQGLGGRLMQPVLAKASAAGLPCYLETMNEANLPFYEKHGFRVANEGVVPGHGLRAWAMLRI